MKYKTKTPTNQAKLTKKEEFFYIKNSISSATPAKLKILAFQINESQRYPLLFHKQKTIGDAVGVVRETVNRITQELNHDGLVRKTNRGWTTCTYELNPLLFNRIIRRFLITFLPILSSFSLLNSCLTENVTPSKNKDLFLFKTNNSSLKTVRLTSTREENYQQNESINRLTKVGNDVAVVFSKKRVTKMENTILEKNVRSLKLSEAGKMRLATYPSSAIAFADKEIQKNARKKKISRPFNYFESLCKHYCTENNLAIDINRSMALFREHPEHIEALPLLENKVLLFDEGKDKNSNQRESLYELEQRKVEHDRTCNELLRQTQQRTKIKNQREREELKQTDPEMAERIERRAKHFRAILCLDEEGKSLNDKMTDADRMRILEEAIKNPSREDQMNFMNASVDKASTVEEESSSFALDSNHRSSFMPDTETATSAFVEATEDMRYDKKGRRVFLREGEMSILPF